MNYQKIYDSLMSKARTRKLEPGFYFERHHIVPRCLGGTNDPENLVDLTAEEHYVAHQLLVKLNPGHAGLVFAAIQMSSNPRGLRGNSRLYGWLRRENSKVQRGKVRSEEHCRKISEAKLGKKRSKPHSEDMRRKISESLKGKSKKPPSEETRLKMAAAKIGKPRGPMSEDHKRKIAEARKAYFVKQKEPQNVV